MCLPRRAIHYDWIESVRPYLQIGAAGLVDKSTGDEDRFAPRSRLAGHSANSSNSDRLKTILVIAATFASILVVAVAARSLLLNTERQSSPAQAQG
jgi:hypothetical protein